MIVRQDHGTHYFACGQPGCGVCGPIRQTYLLAVMDESAHHEACSARKVVAA